MIETWRWFGPKDPISIEEVAQTGLHGIVTALHHVPPGQVWSVDDIRARQAEVATSRDGQPTGLEWSVVESLPVSEDIKRQSGDWRAHIEAYKTSLSHLAQQGLSTICYNFMPVLDWTRTDLKWRLKGGATCMRFDWVDFAVFDLFILGRAANEYSADVLAQATERYAALDEAGRTALSKNVIYGLPGAADNLSLEQVRDYLDGYAAIDETRLRANLAAFLELVAPHAQDLGLRMCCHPDDPPFSLMGLPRIMSTEADYAALTRAVDLPSNGITLCSGSLGAHPNNDLPGMVRRLGDRIHFVHLRNVDREDNTAPGSFHESGHIAGSLDMVAIVAALLDEEARRRAEGRADAEIPFRPDHGLDMFEDQTRGGQPGYPLIGRMVGLSELRGIIETNTAARGV